MQEYRDESKNVHRYEQQLFYLRQDFYKTERKLKRAVQTFEYTLECIEECQSLQEKCMEDTRKTREIVGIQTFHLQEEKKRSERLYTERADRKTLDEAGLFIARKMYEDERKSHSKIVKTFRKLFGMDRALKRSLNDSINSMLNDVEKSQEKAKDILKSIQRHSGHKSLFDRFRGRQSDVVDTERQVVQQAQIKLLVD